MYSFHLVSISVHCLELNLFKFSGKKIIIFALNTKYQKYRVRFIRPFLKKATNVKEKQHSIPLLCYIILVIQRFIMSQSSRSSFRKNIPYKIIAIGNCSDEIFGCSIEVLIPCETMTSRETSFQFQEIIGVSI